MAKVSVLGAGSWGTALSLLLCKNGHEVTLWSALEDEVRMLCEKREHESKLPGVRLPEDMKITADLEDSLQDPDVAVLAVPSPFTRSTAHRMAPFVKKGQIIVNVAKGVEEHTLMTLSEIISEEIPQADVCVLSGPSHGGGGKRSSYNLCGQCRKKRNCRIPAGDLYEPCFPCVYHSGYSGSRAWRRAEKRDRPCGRNSGRSGIWR